MNICLGVSIFAKFDVWYRVESIMSVSSFRKIPNRNVIPASGGRPNQFVITGLKKFAMGTTQNGDNPV